MLRTFNLGEVISVGTTECTACGKAVKLQCCVPASNVHISYHRGKDNKMPCDKAGALHIATAVWNIFEHNGTAKFHGIH